MGLKAVGGQRDRMTKGWIKRTMGFRDAGIEGQREIGMKNEGTER